VRFRRATSQLQSAELRHADHWSISATVVRWAYFFFFGGLTMSSILRLSSRVCERWQASRHSLFVMCVSRSQNLMQSARVLPPPPGALGAASLGLVLKGDDDGTLVVTLPPVSGVVVICGDSGAICTSPSEAAPSAPRGGGRTLADCWVRV